MSCDSVSKWINTTFYSQFILRTLRTAYSCLPTMNMILGYLQRTSNKYAACQCISNASYILSHNNSNRVKLWELTGEFISTQKFDGHIKAVCPQVQNECFLAVIETVSEVGQKNAAVSLLNQMFSK